MSDNWKPLTDLPTSADADDDGCVWAWNPHVNDSDKVHFNNFCNPAQNGVDCYTRWHPKPKTKPPAYVEPKQEPNREPVMPRDWNEIAEFFHQKDFTGKAHLGRIRGQARGLWISDDGRAFPYCRVLVTAAEHKAIKQEATQIVADFDACPKEEEATLDWARSVGFEDNPGLVKKEVWFDLGRDDHVLDGRIVLDGTDYARVYSVRSSLNAIAITKNDVRKIVELFGGKLNEPPFKSAAGTDRTILLTPTNSSTILPTSGNSFAVNQPDQAVNSSREVTATAKPPVNNEFVDKLLNWLEERIYLQTGSQSYEMQSKTAALQQVKEWIEQEIAPKSNLDRLVERVAKDIADGSANTVSPTGGSETQTDSSTACNTQRIIPTKDHLKNAGGRIIAWFRNKGEKSWHPGELVEIRDGEHPYCQNICPRYSQYWAWDECEIASVQPANEMSAWQQLGDAIEEGFRLGKLSKSNLGA